ncbi:hypothetical protein KDH_63030 [Dictyobacter sp. S3.2.2.5]|uniref:Uncharacterized protein n=1 Tax=Dictyobacter halimunensis TaxID=3026934 RepID=A0ABQ6FYW9_9CHLR|nr:hypothetical protein KDH_63030 [Dictyobacter sp. S3.2.2.5]
MKRGRTGTGRFAASARKGRTYGVTPIDVQEAGCRGGSPGKPRTYHNGPVYQHR